MLIEVFKTNIEEEGLAGEIKRMLLLHFPSSRIHFDLEDCDRILRVEGSGFTADTVMMLVKEKGIACTVLD